MMVLQVPFLSLIVPAYNERERIGDTLDTILAYLQKQPWQSQVIIVDDGSRDNTSQLIEAKTRGLEQIKLITYQPNRGKGYAVRQGVVASTGGIVIFTDADLSTPIDEIQTALEHLKNDFDIVIGSRAIAGSKIVRYQPLYRRLGAKVFNLLRDSIVGADISRYKDTQCGFKAFRGTVARRLFGLMQVDGFMFDVELIFLASKLGYRVCEIPVRWKDMPGSKLRLVKDTIRMFKDLALIRFIHRNVIR